ncbi:uncharacterized protein MELLADRAFT_108115 [Melampsora larici-populina 98AG31]|uniref:Secreted protein n=1 Tax=Melampsora larici-populina (strain 98AG31 / pathotype 3-4-7) TaxID=747676 RepID=F4RS08_MELLP|nr:uncharacterized protein MELLADRAFT_108115 [Melampsora larici-populina 98AG31]EGG04861.1 secreted protein [Melampsora larici-populina 98AG31]
MRLFLFCLSIFAPLFVIGSIWEVIEEINRKKASNPYGFEKLLGKEDANHVVKWLEGDAKAEGEDFENLKDSYVKEFGVHRAPISSKVLVNWIDFKLTDIHKLQRNPPSGSKTR